MMTRDSQQNSSAKCPSCGGVIGDPMLKICPHCEEGLSQHTQPCPGEPPFFSVPQMRYQSAYVWLVLLSTIDIILTYLVVHHWKGYEANPLAAIVIGSGRWLDATLYKFGFVVLAIMICEAVGRISDRHGRKLSIALIIIGALPIVYTYTLLLANPYPTDIVP